ncbi:galactose-specific lectin nattectin-like [Centropristis striata]|uniref:galactose-specific lectin nattectin-like n=1 Tax=Centropristis striata TaxID=184440 RepID=UPI0027E0C1D7|nr:galactose-specific lectin nattectin-like [Centropristis striata]
MASGFHFALLLCVTSGLLSAASCCEEDKKKDCPASCPDGWTRFGSRCFMFHFTPKTWIEAEKTCLSFSGNLASVHSVEDHTFLKEHIRRVAGANRLTLIGGFDAVKEGVWQWSDGTPFDYTRWSPGQPDNYGNNEHCSHMNWNDNFWNDLSCTYKASFVCSKSL